MSCLGMPHLTEMPCMGMVTKLYHSLKMVGKALGPGRYQNKGTTIQGGSQGWYPSSSYSLLKDLTECKALLEMQNRKEPYVLYI
jgi:hypothetical protein